MSKALLDAETRYSHLEKLALALMVAARKLRPYFQAHPVVVITSFPIKLVLHKPEVYGQLAKWAVELGEYDIIFQPATAIKSLSRLRGRILSSFTPGSRTGGTPSEWDKGRRGMGPTRRRLQ